MIISEANPREMVKWKKHNRVKSLWDILYLVSIEQTNVEILQVPFKRHTESSYLKSLIFLTAVLIELLKV